MSAPTEAELTYAVASYYSATTDLEQVLALSLLQAQVGRLVDDVRLARAVRSVAGIPALKVVTP